MYALATRSASGVVPLLSTSHTKSCSSSGSDRASAFAGSARVFLNRLALLAGTSAAVAREVIRTHQIVAERLASEHSDRLTPETFFAQPERAPEAAQ